MALYLLMLGCFPVTPFPKRITSVEGNVLHHLQKQVMIVSSGIQHFCIIIRMGLNVPYIYMDAMGNDVCGHFGGLTKTIQKEKIKPEATSS